ncbi:MAG: hypothetical protein AB1497_06880 [Bacillota bacterium]
MPVIVKRGVVLLTAFALTLVASSLLAGWWSKGPMSQRLGSEFESIPGVMHADLETVAGKTTVTVTFSDVEDLPAVYLAVVNTASRSLKHGNYRIELKDAASNGLDQVYQELHYHVFEAARTGNYGRMREAFKIEAPSLNVGRWKLTVTADYIFVQLWNEGGYLHRVVPVGAGGTGGDAP